MKLIVTGANGFVASEVIRQCLSHPDITELIAVSRKVVSPPEGLDPGADIKKLTSVIIKDYDDYPEDVRRTFAGAAGCIWTVAITASGSINMDFSEVTRICHTSTIRGLQAMYEAGPVKPFRFLYVSGMAGQRDKAIVPLGPSTLHPYAYLRGETENEILAFAAAHKDEVEACAAKPAKISPLASSKPRGDGPSYLARWSKDNLNVIPTVALNDMAAALIHEVVHGFEVEPLQSDDLNRIGQKALANLKTTDLLLEKYDAQ